MKLRTIEHSDDITVVELEGNLDTGGVREVDTQLYAIAASRKLNTAVDLSKVEFMGSMGIGMLISCARTLASTECSLAIVGPTGLVRTSLEAVKIEDIIPIVDSIADAERLFDSR